MLDFLWDKKVGDIASLVALRGGRGVEDELARDGEEEGWLGHP